MISQRNEMSNLFYKAWLEKAASITGYVPEIYWQGVAENTDPDPTKAYARFTLKHQDSEQTTFGEKNHRRFTRLGIITVQVFSPIEIVGGGLTEAEQLAEIVRDAYEGIATPSGINFRNVRVTEVGRTQQWYQFNITTTFDYDEVK